MTNPSVLGDVKSLIGKSAIYGFGSILLRAFGFVLLPLYTRYLTPADYGVLAVTGTIMAVLSILYPLGLHGAVTRFYFTPTSIRERKANEGTIWIAMLLASLGTALLLDNFGAALFLLLFPDIPFDPFIRLSIWTSFLSIFSLLPPIFFQVEERPAPYVFLTVGGALLTIVFVVYFVVFQSQGVLGYLRGSFFAALLLVVPYIFLTLKNVRISWRWDILRFALVFSLPLVPHNLANWVLELSDRAILARYVSLEALGLYSLGYQLGTVTGLLVAAFNNAWVPFLYKTVAQQGVTANSRLARITTYYALVLCFGALGVALFAKSLIAILAAPVFHSAYIVTPWVAGAYVFTGLYMIPMGLLFWKERTKFIPVVTIVSGVCNVALNLWLIPRYGILGAAWSTFLSYGLMLILVWGISLRIYPLPYEYRRLGQIGMIAVGMATIGSFIQVDEVLLDLSLKGGIWLAFPMLLATSGFFTSDERQMVISFKQQLLERLRPVPR